MSSHVLGNKDVNASMEQQQQQQTAQSKDVKSMDYHRQVFQSKMAQEPYVARKPASAPSSRLTTPAAAAAAAAASRPVVLFRPTAVLAKNTATCSDASTQQYVSPSDNIMSPCSAKINALRNKHVSKAKPKSLFAQASAKKLSGENLFGSKSIPMD
ncbi:hypothetical protein G3M48_004549 [Beauveria asiatica]|uniref:Spo12-like protein n=1 Tax=Beauveria asiatica TaxID=1069075 RepID=A0AAW0RSU7_9HYPO